LELGEHFDEERAADVLKDGVVVECGVILELESILALVVRAFADHQPPTGYHLDAQAKLRYISDI